MVGIVLFKYLLIGVVTTEHGITLLHTNVNRRLAIATLSALGDTMNSSYPHFLFVSATNVELYIVSTVSLSIHSRVYIPLFSKSTCKLTRQQWLHIGDIGGYLHYVIFFSQHFHEVLRSGDISWVFKGFSNTKYPV